MKMIKRERQVRLDELIKYCIDNDTFGTKGVFTSTTGKISVTVYKDDVVIKDAYMEFNITKTLFTITEEVEIDEETVLPRVVHISKFGETYDHRNVTIKWLIQYHEDSALGLSDLRYIYLQNKDGSIGELIWKDGGMVD